MRHRVAGLTLSRTSAHRQALFSNLVAALLTHESIRTTDAKAKETRRLAERTITWARRVGDVLAKKPDRRSAEESARVVHAVRMARRVVRDRGAVAQALRRAGAALPRAPRAATRASSSSASGRATRRRCRCSSSSRTRARPAAAKEPTEAKAKGAKAAKAEAAPEAKAPAKAGKKAAASDEKAAAKKPAKPAKK